MMALYRGGLSKLLQFLGKRSDDPMTEVTKQDVVVFRNSLITQVSAKTANHDLKALKTLFKLRVPTTTLMAHLRRRTVTGIGGNSGTAVRSFLILRNPYDLPN
jgi:site-specific recombinase XerD